MKRVEYVNIQLTPEQYAALSRVAYEQNGGNMSLTIRKALVDKHPEFAEVFDTKPIEQPRRRRAPAGVASKG